MSDVLAWATIVVEGDDAQSFLDGQLSQQITNAMTGSWSNVLEPTGEVISALWVRGDDGRFEILVPEALVDAVLQRLRRFLIRVRCVVSAHGAAENPPLRTMSECEDAHMPWVNEFERRLLPHSFGSSYVNATVSFTKGCFTGQELVGRMDARGATMPWRFVVAQGPSLSDIEQFIDRFGPPGPKGVTTVLDGEFVRAYAIAHRSALSDDAKDENVTLRAVS